MNIASLSAASSAQAAALAAQSAASMPSTFGTDLESALTDQPTAGSSTTQSASKTQPERATPSAGHRHHHQRDTGDGTSIARASTGVQTAATQASSPTGTGLASTQSAGQVLLSDMMRGLQAYGATITAG